jgi:hypothetical protein
MRTARVAISYVIILLSAGCTSTSINTALGTPKNPSAVYADPNSKYRDDDNKFIYAAYGVLLESLDDTKGNRLTIRKTVDEADMRRYLSAGYTLSDMYCSRYFRKSDESSRRRRFGRSATNDVGTAVTTVLGLVNAGESAVTALAAATGLADSSWRNYDDSFMISPELSSVQGLVEAAQDNYRSKTLGKDAQLPAEFATAQHMIQRYANLCSHLGMKRLLQESATIEQRALNQDTDKRNAGETAPAVVPAAPTGTVQSAPAATSTIDTPPATALPSPPTSPSNNGR